MERISCPTCGEEQVVQIVGGSGSCPTCPGTSGESQMIENRPQVADWLKQMGKTSNIPHEYLPEVDTLQSYTIKTNFPTGLRVFVFASEPGSHETPDAGYGEYENSTIAQVAEGGSLTFILQRPGSYCLEDPEDLCYPAHIHLVPESTTRPGEWSTKLYTYVV